MRAIKNTYTEWGVDMKLYTLNSITALGKLPDYDFIITDENHHALCNYI